jgi:hypothetical protein
MLELPADKNLIAVPGEAIYGSNRLYKLADDRMQMIEFERVGERAYGSGRTQVLARTSQLVVGDKVIVTKLANAADGLLVKATTSINADESNTALSKNTPEVDLK